MFVSFWFIWLQNGINFHFSRKLCIEALVEEGDQNQDWRLTSKEFFRLMEENYQPSNKCKCFRLIQPQTLEQMYFFLVIDVNNKPSVKCKLKLFNKTNTLANSANSILVNYGSIMKFKNNLRYIHEARQYIDF
jgi:hypothetical protein